MDTIVANITNQQSLVDMCNRARVLVNCVGPVYEKKKFYWYRAVVFLVSLVW